MYYQNDSVVISFEGLLYIDTTPTISDNYDVVLGYKDQRKLQMTLSADHTRDLTKQFTDFLEFKKNIVPNHVNISEEQLNQIIGTQLTQAIINQTTMYSQHIEELIRANIQPHLKELQKQHSEVNQEIEQSTTFIRNHKKQLEQVSEVLSKIIIVD